MFFEAFLSKLNTIRIVANGIAFYGDSFSIKYDINVTNK